MKKTVFNLANVMDQKGVSKYFLVKQMGITYKVINKMMNNEIDCIYFKTLDKLCKLLDCDAHELFATIEVEDEKE